MILLHGWLGSWDLWHKTMSFLSAGYRTYALDFWGFGESGKKRESYQINDFVELVEQFMEQLGILRAPIIGHSMGGTVSMAFAIKYPERVTKVGVIGSPVTGDSLSILLKLAGVDFIGTLVHYNMWALKLGIRLAAPLITKDRRWADMISDSLSQTTLDSFFLSIKSLHDTDLRDSLGSITTPLMGMYGRKDLLVHPNQRELIRDIAPDPYVVYLEDAGHFPMLDEPDNFMLIIKNFLDQETPPPTPPENQ